MLKIVNQETLVPLGVAVIAIGTVTAWVVELKNRVQSHTEVIEALRQTNDAQVKLIYEINGRLSRIEWKLETK